jgi:hypothetical protein
MLFDSQLVGIEFVRTLKLVVKRTFGKRVKFVEIGIIGKRGCRALSEPKKSITIEKKILPLEKECTGSGFP